MRATSRVTATHASERPGKASSPNRWLSHIHSASTCGAGRLTLVHT